MEIDQSLDLERDHLFDRIVLYSATGLFAITIVLTTIQIFVRLLGLPTFGVLHWTEPAARFILIVATYIGAAVAVRNSEHISIQFLLERLTGWNPRIGLTIQILGELIVIGFLLVALRGTIGTAIGNWATSIGGIGFVTAGNLYLGIAIGIALMLVYAVIDIVTLAKGITDDTVRGRVEEGMADE
ncbi:TRAP transporter small permease [Halalkalicoccus sp. NIPERK01]|uniref:TRAP transporter small permease n=1 Tax=Halalkalicoccus sp. NIPERK01 TaxID=3053469 RepID=UPI00256EFDE1|nr:TRAP transporter small permease subunit [Halalkalicoccus sp. NIPERK01]MDL5363382.1 TRAP transporter small permease subunit [Halalkalicoccus sp. NIPERK01]